MDILEKTNEAYLYGSIICRFENKIGRYEIIEHKGNYFEVEKEKGEVKEIKLSTKKPLYIDIQVNSNKNLINLK